METIEFAKKMGSYEPGFLHMCVHTEKDLSDLNGLIEEAKTDPEKQKLFSTFLHEYIHFLQDISTSYGLMHGFNYIERLKDIITHIKRQEQAEFTVPFPVDNQFNVLSNMDLMKLYLGDVEAHDHVKYQGYDIELVPVSDKDGKIFSGKKYKVHFLDCKKYSYRSFYFGGRCIKEYMTHTLQKMYYPAVEHPDIPYAIAGLIAEVEYPPIGKEPLFVYALCDASLMSLHPSQFFFETLERMKASCFTPGDLKDIYAFAYSDIRFQGPMGNFDVQGLHDHTAGLAIYQYGDALKSPVFSPNRNWLHYLVSCAKDIRQKIPDFMTWLVAGDNELSDDFKMVNQLLGSPFFTNDTENGWFIPPAALTNETNIQPYQLLVFKQLLLVFDGHTKCGLYQFCKKRTDKEITNNKCLSAPWERVNDKDELCPFAQFWKTWGLTGKIPVKVKT